MSENPYLEEFRAGSLKGLGSMEVDGREVPWYDWRAELVNRYSWAIPDDKVIEMIREAASGRTVVDLGCGSGYWVYVLRQAGVDAIGVDLLDHHTCQTSDQWVDVIQADAAEYAATLDPTKHYPMLVWPPYKESVDTRIYSALYAQGFEDLLYVGEDGWGCTGSEEGNHNRISTWPYTHIHYIPTHYGINDYAVFHGSCCGPLPKQAKKEE